MSLHVRNFVQEYRIKNKITQEDLGKAVGVTRQTIIAIEKGNYTPSVLLALTIATYFNTTVEKLFTIER
jgi:putative transcriptional regulator